MAPTEILAEQHYRTICQLLSDFKIDIGLITGSYKKISNFQITPASTSEAGRANSKQIKNSPASTSEAGRAKFKIKNITDDCQVVIGTHALIQDKINFENLSLAIVDEQHRFGVNQRSALITRTNTDKHGLTLNISDKGKNDKTNLLFEDLTYKIRGAIFKIKKELGLGHKEKIYQNALEQEFIKSKINFEKEKSININYDNKKIGVYRPDFVVEDKIIVELKKLPFVGKFEKDQVWHYLKGSKYQLALLVNFANDDVQIQRFIHTKVHAGQHESVSSFFSPHFLSMTATPIPRSLALALYGDLDLSIIDEMPKGRKKILTKIVSEDKRQQAYDFIKQEIKNGRQAFVICPLIDISDKLGVKSAKEEFEKLNEIIFPEIEIGILHGKMKSAEKEKVMQEFLANKIKILVSTSVVEVGVDVPNATIMMIEGADRFGLAQIHQFRGRVGRSDYQSHCFLFTDSESIKTQERLQAVVDYHSGLELAKMDLKFRGPGEVYGTIQKGFPELKIASLYDYELMRLAKEQAEMLIKKDNSLDSWPVLKQELGEWERKVHLE
jgi:GxxExxY protein